jgi:hypothetical protein
MVLCTGTYEECEALASTTAGETDQSECEAPMIAKRVSVPKVRDTAFNYGAADNG